MLTVEERTPPTNQAKLSVCYRERAELQALEPPLDEIDSFCLDAWSRLDTCRPLGMDVAGAIPVTAILAWADFRALDRQLTQLVLDVIQLLDGERAARIRSKRALK